MVLRKERARWQVLLLGSVQSTANPPLTSSSTEACGRVVKVNQGVGWLLHVLGASVSESATTIGFLVWSR